jgi:hypothetical protein
MLLDSLQVINISRKLSDGKWESTTQMSCHVLHCVSGEKAENTNKLVEREFEILQKLCHYDDSRIGEFVKGIIFPLRICGVL